MTPRLSHCKLYKGKPVFGDKFDKVVTTAWSYEPDVSILTYVATVYTKNSKTDFWKRKSHKEETLKRFRENPIRIKLISERGPELMNNAVDWCIATDLIFKFGVFNKNTPDVRRVHHEYNIYSDFNDRYYTEFSHIYEEETQKQTNPLFYYTIGVATTLLAYTLVSPTCFEMVF
jgi:hypothetical protein